MHSNQQSMAQLSKHKLLVALVRTFFQAFATGTIEASAPSTVRGTSPAQMKALMLEHYEHIAPAFIDTIFFPLAAMNYNYADMEQVVRQARQEHLDMMALLRKACATDAMYEALVHEYKRHFGCLLAGRLMANAELLAAYASIDNILPGTIPTDRAIELSVRVVMHAYAKGLRGAATATPATMQQATLLRLMLDAMNIVLNDEAVTFSGDEEPNLADMFMKVCHTQHNFTVMTDEMDRTYEEIEF